MGYNARVLGTALNYGWNQVSNWFSNLWKSVERRFLGTGLTGAENEANAFTHNERLEAQDFNAEEAQKSRDFTEYMTRNKYAMETQSMQEAGLNPAMMYGGGNLVSTVANGAAGTSSGGSSVSPDGLNPLDLVLSLIRFPKELQQLKENISETRAAAQEHRDLGEAALINAHANWRNSGTQEGELGVHQRQNELRELEIQIQRDLVDSNIGLNDERKKEIAENALYLKEQRETISRYIAVAEKNADSQQKQAIAALRNADAAVQNAATNSYLSDYQSSLMYSSELLNWYQGDGQQIINQYLPEKQRAEIDKLLKEGVKLDKEGRLIDKQGNLVTAQTIKTYVNCGTDIANSVSRFVGISALANRPAPTVVNKEVVSPDMLYGNYGTFYGQ